MHVTIYDVAREADVSLATVSRVLNNNRHVRDSTRRRVQEAIDRLGFEPNHVASALTTKRTRLVALLVPDVSTPFYAEVTWGAANAASRRDYSCIVHNVGERTHEQAVGMLRRKGIDGIIFGTTNYDDELIAKLSDRGFPLALIERDVPEVRANRVLLDDAAGGALGAQHLLELGHTHVAMVVEPERSAANQARIHGFEEALRAANASFILLTAPGSDIAAGVEAGERLLAEPSRPTAVLAANDLLAIGIMEAARKAQLRVPQDLSVVGFDGTMMAKVVQPPLTTIVPPMRDMGRTAVELLLETLENDGQSRRVVITPELRVGGTTARPRR